MYNIKYYKVSIKFKEKILLNNIDLSCLEDDPATSQGRI